MTTPYVSVPRDAATVWTRLVLAVLAALVLVPLSAAQTDFGADGLRLEPLSAHWIWRRQSEPRPYNQTIIARKTFRLKHAEQARLRITADSFYRLFINGRWVADGPCRSWPEHFQYDVLDVAAYLQDGVNEIQVVARHYGVGDFHRIPQQAGLLAQLDVWQRQRLPLAVVTDRSWDIAVAHAWLANTPKVSIQMEPAEWYDGRVENNLTFNKAVELFSAGQGPWKDLNPRDVALLTRQPCSPRKFVGATVVQAPGRDFCLPAARLVNPGVIEANHSASCACGMATVLVVSQDVVLQTQSEGFRVAVDGREVEDGRFALAPGEHIMLALVREVCSHEKEKSLRLLNPEHVVLRNPVQTSHENPWCFLRFPEYAFATNDLRWISFRQEDPVLAAKIDGFQRTASDLLGQVKSQADFHARLAARAELMPNQQMFVQDSFWQFAHRQVVKTSAPLVDAPQAAMHDHAAVTVIHPHPRGDVELLYDLGEQNCGYYQFELTASEGTIVDLFAVEYIAPDGRIQHSWGNRNGLRYIAHQGVNRFTSLKRRSGRFLFLTLRNLQSPVYLHSLQLIQSTYPVNAVGEFRCSDARLDKIWEISARTLKLCMEDTFTDCPLYEQTHWVGDARNESLFAYTAFGATDIARRCIQQTAQSLDRYPFAGCQVPSGWDCLLPAWSFLWGISTWDYYWYTGDTAFLRAIQPSVIRNLRGAAHYVNDQGLFSGPFWNLFDWTPIDQGQKTVLHNNLFMVGAIDAALKAGQVLGDSQQTAWLQDLRLRLVRGVNRLWDDAKQSYPDSIRDDGSISPSTSQHTSFLSLLYDIVEPQHREAAQRNLLVPPDKMVRIGSPFAMLYLYETLEKIGMPDQIMKQIYANYLPMLEAGATTVWESFPTGTTGSDGFPTRSHCHAWSSAPVYFLNRIVLGIQPATAGADRVVISPRPSGLSWAQGATATRHGPIQVNWVLNGRTLEIKAQAPESVQLQFVPNDALQPYEVQFNGKKVGP
jgi:alpha-L-rhamnosidase